MLKQIPLQDLRMGMFIQKMGGRWFDHPFVRSSFKISSEKDYQLLRDSGLPDLIIDTDKGLDGVCRARCYVSHTQTIE